MNIDNPSITLVTLLRGEHEFIPLIKENLNKFEYPKDKLELIIVDDGTENYMSEFLDDERILYLHLSEKEITDFLHKINIPGDEEKIQWNYLFKTRRLPNGFKRDYGVGMGSNDLYFHMDYDTSYNPKTLLRKLKFMKEHRIECVYCTTLLGYDIYNKDIYNTESPYKFYEATALHTKDYWSNGGFKWSDIKNEGRFFSLDHGTIRKQDNYYDSVKILSIRNINEYHPKKLDMEKSSFTLELHKEIVDSIKIEYNPFKQSINELFKNEQLNILGIHSEFIQSLDDEGYTTYNITNSKIKQNKISKEIKKIGTKFSVLLYGYKQPLWDFFEEIIFDCIILETPKNSEQMMSIISKCKNNQYIIINNMFINKKFLTKE
jgi:hypothetical protein